MRLDNSIDTILGSGSKVRILRLFTIHPGLEVTKRELARMVGLSHTAVNAAIPDLAERGLLRVKYAGRSHVYSIDRRSYLFEPLCEIFKKESKFREDMIGLIRSGLTGVGTCILFGSYARGDDTDRTTDVDLLIVTRSKSIAWKKINDTALKVQEIYGISISPIVMSEHEFKAKRNKPVYRNAVSEGRFLVEEKELSI